MPQDRRLARKLSPPAIFYELKPRLRSLGREYKRIMP